MELNFDSAKTSDEELLDKIIVILEATIPEQGVDAMSDYSKALNLLEQTTDIRPRSLIQDLRDLYIYPERTIHNTFMKNIHGVKEMMQEERIDMVIKSSSGKPSEKSLSGLGSSKRNKLVVVLAALALLWYLRSK